LYLFQILYLCLDQLLRRPHLFSFCFFLVTIVAHIGYIFQFREFYIIVQTILDLADIYIVDHYGLFLLNPGSSQCRTGTDHQICRFDVGKFSKAIYIWLDWYSLQLAEHQITGSLSHNVFSAIMSLTTQRFTSISMLLNGNWRVGKTYIMHLTFSAFRILDW